MDWTRVISTIHQDRLLYLMEREFIALIVLKEFKSIATKYGKHLITTSIEKVHGLTILTINKDLYQGWGSPFDDFTRSTIDIF